MTQTEKNKISSIKKVLEDIKDAYVELNPKNKSIRFKIYKNPFDFEDVFDVVHNNDDFERIINRGFENKEEEKFYKKFKKIYNDASSKECNFIFFSEKEWEPYPDF